MPTVPDTAGVLVVRTDFSSDATWDALRGRFGASLSFLSDRAFDGLTPQEVAALPRATYRKFLFLVDRMAIAHPEAPFAAVDLQDEPGRWFRIAASQVWTVENNLSLSNMDFAEFAGAADPDGVFRGFRPQRTPVPEGEAQQQHVPAGSRTPTERLRAVGGLYAQTLIELDSDLAVALAETDDGTRRAVAAWSAVRALEQAGLINLTEISPAVAALRRGEQAPPPFDDHSYVWPILSNAAVARTMIPAPPAGEQEQSPQDWAITTLFHSAEADSLTAVLDILVALAFVCGRDGYQHAFAEVKAKFPQLRG